MPDPVRALQGEVLDALCRREYGTERGGIVEAVLEANPGLAALGVTLPLGTLVRLPDIKPSNMDAPVVTLWD